MRGLPSIPAALAIVLLATGCGESAIGSFTLTKEMFIREADQICFRADTVQPREFEQFTAENKEELDKLAPIPYEETMAVDYLIPSIKGEIRELEGIDVPVSERKEFAKFIARWKTAVREGERDPYSIANFWVPAQDPLAPVNKAATRYGFEGCNELR